MKLLCYPRMCRDSQLCMRRTRWRWGKSYQYRPHRQMINRLAMELGMTTDEVYNQIMRERRYLLENPQEWRA